MFPKEHTYQIKKLNTLEMLKCETHAKKLFRKLFSGDNETREILTALCEHACLCYYCLYQKQKRMFSSPFKVLQKLTIDELCEVYDSYYALGDEVEAEYNSTFEAQLENEKVV